MKKTTITLLAAIITIISISLPDSANAQLAGTFRKDLQRHDLSTPNREVIQAEVGLKEGIKAPRHSHPGEEVIYVLKGDRISTGRSASRNCKSRTGTLHSRRCCAFRKEHRQRRSSGTGHLHR